MPSNSNISNNKASWTHKNIYDQSPPKWISDTLTNFKNTLDTIRGIINGIVSVLDVLRLLWKGLDDILVTFLMGIVNDIITVLTDSLTAGGSYIIIHPWNSKLSSTINILEKNSNGTYKQISTLVVPIPVIGSKSTAISEIKTIENKAISGNKNKVIIPLRSLTPQQAFNDFYNSFTDLSDRNRPQWSSNDYATGFGIVITTPDINGFISLINTLQEFFSFPELNELTHKFLTEVRTGIQNAGTDIQEIGTELGENWGKFTSDLSKIGTDVNIIFSKNPNTATQRTQLVTNLITSPFTGTRHWNTLSLQNIPLLDDLSSEIKKLIQILTGAIQGSGNIIDELSSALLKKLNALLSIIDSVDSLVSTLVTSLGTTGLYTFSVPSGLGGVEYVKQAIQSSLSTSPLADGLNSSTWTFLFFAGVGGPTMDTLQTWLNMFSSTLSTAVDSGFDSSITNLQTVLSSSYNFNYNIEPNFKTKIFHFNDVIKLRVSSIQSTATNQYYYTYTMRDSNGTIISKQSQTNISAPDIAKVNITSFDIILKIPEHANKRPIGSKKYSIEVRMFNAVGKVSSYNSNFIVTDTISVPPATTPNSKYAGYQICTILGCTVKLYDGSLLVYEQYIGPNSCAIIGAGLPYGDYTIQIDEVTGTQSDWSINNINGYYDYLFTSVSILINTPFIRVNSLPVILCFSFSGILELTYPDGTTKNINLPSCIEIDQAGCYSYSIFDGTTTLGPYSLYITLISDTSISVC